MANKKGSTKKASTRQAKKSNNDQVIYLRPAQSPTNSKPNNPANEQLSNQRSYSQQVLSAIDELRKRDIEMDDVDEAMIAMMAAAFSGQTDKVPQLYEQLQAAANAGNSELEMELFYAVTEGNIEQTRRLIDMGVDVNARDEFGNTPLHIAVEKNFVNTVYWLLAAGADPKLEDELDKTAHQLAQEALTRYQEIVRLLNSPNSQPSASNPSQHKQHQQSGKSNYTPRQGQFLAFIYYYTKLHHRAPAETDFQAYFKTSPPAVHQMILTLEKLGFIEKTPGQARSIRLLLSRDQLPDLE